MSASLVGSEMCIRDRSRSGVLALGGLHPDVEVAISSVGIPVRAVESVSYTHLTLPTICSV
eukprot:13989966-Alexandrium_andersonii.AAC.1